MTTWIFLSLACSAKVTCPEGSPPVDGTCPPIADSGGQNHTGQPDTGPTQTLDSPLPAAVAEPEPAIFPDTIGVLSVAVRTADTTYAGTDDNSLTLCLGDTHCWKLDVADVDDFRVGELDVHHFEEVDLPRLDVDRVQIVSESGEDQWRPECLAVQFDGEPVYCADGLSDLKFGIEEDERQSWQDPAGLHLACSSCDPTGITHGPVLGALEADRARIWIRTDATRRAGLRLSLDTDLQDAQVVAWGDPSPSRDYTHVFDVPGLAPETRYIAGIEIDGELDPNSVLEFTTPPPLGTPGDLSFAFGSCIKYAEQPIFDTIAADQPDLFLFLGDNHYANTNDLNGLRWHYRWALNVPERAALARQTVSLATWDDHDFVGNNTDGNDSGKETALRVFKEYWVNTSYGTDSIPGVFHQHQVQDVAFFFIDDRYYRDVEEDMLGAAQTAWLLEALSASTARFKFLISGSQWTLEGSTDSWANFPEARDALFQSIFDRGIEGVVLLSGDIHRSEFLWLDQPYGYDLLELTSSPLANSNSTCDTRDDQVFCHDSDRYYVRVDVSSDDADPSFVATLVSEAGAEQGSVSVRLSELSLP